VSQNHRERKQDVLVNVILDKSGSMAGKTNDVIEGFNAYVAGLGKEDQVNYLFSLTLFDTQVAYRHVAIPLAEVQKLDSKSYQPGGNTALNDAIGITVRKVDADQPKVDKVVTVIMTDGEENSSREWTHDAVKGLIEQKEKEGTWTFVFLGAGLDAWHQGRSYGIQSANVAQYSAEQYCDAFAAMALSTNAVSSSPKLRSENFFGSLSREFLRKAGLRQEENKS
jgi:uncharacterized protein YegL